MTHHDFLDANTAERLLSGAVPAAAAPPGYGPVASVLAAAAIPVPVPAMDFEELARVARSAAVRPGPSTTRRSPMLGKLLTMKAAAAAGVILIGATGAAAATGSLPNAVQRVAHSTLAHVGVDVPDDHPANADHQADDPSTTDTTVPADGSAPGATPAVAGDNGAAGTDAATDDHGQDPTDTLDPATAQDPSDDSQPGVDQSGDGHDGGTATTPTTAPSPDGGSGSGSDGTGSDSGHGGSSSHD